MAQVVLLIGSQTWILSAKIERKVEGSHMGFLSHITVDRALRKVEGIWETSRAVLVREAAGTQLVMTYIGRQQGMVSQWVALRPIFEVCA